MGTTYQGILILVIRLRIKMGSLTSNPLHLYTLIKPQTMPITIEASLQVRTITLNPQPLLLAIMLPCIAIIIIITLTIIIIVKIINPPINMISQNLPLIPPLLEEKSLKQLIHQTLIKDLKFWVLFLICKLMSLLNVLLRRMVL